jgi:hypothetical protein
MNIRLSEQLEQVQRDLSRNLAEADRMGKALADLGARLQREPAKWSVDWVGAAFPEGDWAQPIEPEMLEALDRNRLSWLLDDIRILQRRETELKRLALA